MIFRRILRYGIVLFVIFAIISVLSICKNWDIIASYFTNSFFSLIEAGLYFLIIGAGFWWLIKSVFR